MSERDGLYSPSPFPGEKVDYVDQCRKPVVPSPTKWSEYASTPEGRAEYEASEKAATPLCLSCGKEFVPPAVKGVWQTWWDKKGHECFGDKAINLTCDFAEAFHQSQIRCEECRK